MPTASLRKNRGPEIKACFELYQNRKFAMLGLVIIIIIILQNVLHYSALFSSHFTSGFLKQSLICSLSFSTVGFFVCRFYDFNISLL